MPDILNIKSGEDWYAIQSITGPQGAAGVSITSVTKVSTAGLVDTYRIDFSNSTSTTFTITNGEDGAKGDTGDAAGFGTPTATASSLPTGSAPTASVTASGSATAKVFAFNFGIPTGATGATGNGISSIAKTGTVGLVDTYTVTFTNGTTTTFTVTNGTSELESTTGQSTVKGMTQKAITDELTGLNEDITQLETDLATQTRINTKQSREIANLRQQAPADTVVNYPDTTYGKGEVPTSVCKYAEVNKINGCSRVWNQLIPTEYKSGTSSASDTRQDFVLAFQLFNGDTYVSNEFAEIVSSVGVFNKIFTSTHSASNVLVKHSGSTADINIIPKYSCNIVSNHKYLLSIKFSSIDISTVGGLIHDNAFLIDLTLLYGSGNEPTTVAQFKADYPLPYYAYNAGEIKSSTLTAFNSKGVNIWDEEWESGKYSVTTGVKEPASTRIRCKNLIPVIPSTTYYFKASADRELLQYDANGNFVYYNIEDGANVAFTTRSDCYYITFSMYSSYGTTYNHDIQICLNSVSTKTTYHPYNAHSTSLPQAITLKSAGNAKDEYVPSTGAVTRNIASYTFTGNESIYAEGNYFVMTIPNMNGSGEIPNIISSLGLRNSSTGDKFMYMRSSGIGVVIKNTDITTTSAMLSYLAGSKIHYELATPTSESVTPIDDFIEVEAEGEMSLTHTETPAMDSRFTVTYANLS